MRTLTDNDVDAIATAIAAKLKPAPPADPFDLFTRLQAAGYCNLSPRTFDRERERVPAALAPAGTEGPLAKRWHRCALDVYKMTGGAVVPRGRGRPRNRAPGATA